MLAVVVQSVNFYNLSSFLQSDVLEWLQSGRAQRNPAQPCSWQFLQIKQLHRYQLLQHENSQPPVFTPRHNPERWPSACTCSLWNSCCQRRPPRLSAPSLLLALLVTWQWRRADVGQIAVPSNGAQVHRQHPLVWRHILEVEHVHNRPAGGRGGQGWGGGEGRQLSRHTLLEHGGTCFLGLLLHKHSAPRQPGSSNQERNPPVQRASYKQHWEALLDPLYALIQAAALK